MSYLFRLARTLRNVGFDVYIVLDGEERHVSKRASISRRAKFYEKKASMKLLKAKLMDITSRINSLNDTIDAANNSGLHQYLIDEKQKLSTNLQSIEEDIVKASIDVGDKLYNALLRKIDESNITNIYIIQAQFQADTILALRCITDKNEFVFSNDTDQAVLCGSKCFSIKKYTLVQKCNEYTINGIEIFSSSLLSIQLMCLVANSDRNSGKIPIPSEFPTFFIGTPF